MITGLGKYSLRRLLLLRFGDAEVYKTRGSTHQMYTKAWVFSKKNLMSKFSFENLQQRKKPKEKKTFRVTASSIFAEPENASVYYIFGTDLGKIAIIDIFFDDHLSLNPVFLSNYHTAKIYFMMIIDQKYLIAASEDGVISITDVCKSTIERALERYKAESFRRDSVNKKRKE